MVEQYNIILERGSIKTKKRPEQKKKKHSSTWYYLGLVGQIGYTTAIPLALGAIIGSWADKQGSSYPLWTITGLALGFALSAASFYRVIADIAGHKKL